MPNLSGRKVARRIGHLGRLGRAGHCCCLMNQRPALVLMLAKSSPTLMARPRGPHGALPAQLAPSLRLLRLVAVLAITPMHELAEGPSIRPLPEALFAVLV